MAPEQMRGARDVDHRADIFSLGVVFYEMLTGQLPIGRFEAPSRRVHVDVRLDEIVLRALESRPERRYQSAIEVKGDVEAVSRNPAPATAPARARRAPIQRREAKRMRWAWAALTAFTLGAPWFARGAWALGTAGLLFLLALSLGAGVLAWRMDLARSPADPQATPESTWRRLDRTASALLLALLGLTLTAATVLAVWERGTPHSSPLRRGDAAWNADAGRTALRRLEAYAAGDLPELGDPAVQASSSVWTWRDARPATSALLAAAFLLGAAALLLRGRRFASRGELARSLVGVPLWAALPLIYGGLWYELPGLRSALRSSGEIVGELELPGYADDNVDALVTAARERGYEVLERRVLVLRSHADLAPLARRVLVRLCPRSLFERWSLEKGGPRRPRPELFLDALCDVRTPGTSLAWSAGLIQKGAPEEAVWRAEVDALAQAAVSSAQRR